MSWVSGYGEGWATYAERLMGELGYLDDDPGAYLGMLDMQMMAAATVALDIGVHLELEIPDGTGRREGERWNAGIAWEFLRAHSSWNPHVPWSRRPVRRNHVADAGGSVSAAMHAVSRRRI
jgi:uncharacterized protein (DUF885 family)